MSRPASPARSRARTEILAGITSFLATMYIIVVNPSVLQNAGLPFEGVLTATVLVSAFSSIAMGVYARNPIVLAPGMGLNAFFAFTVVGSMGVAWETALGAVFWSGVIFLLLAAFNVRTRVVQAVPDQLRYAIAVGIGLFIALIGLSNAGFVVSNPVTIVGRGPLDAVTLTFLFGLLVTSLLLARRVPGALILGITVTTLAAIPVGRIWGEVGAVAEASSTLVTWRGFLAAPDFSLVGRLDLTGALSLSLWPVIFTFLFTDLFDSTATFMGIAEAGNLKDPDGSPRNIKQSMMVDSLATMSSGLLGTSAATSYIESVTGIEEGGRTGLTAVTAGLCFLPFLFLSPLVSIVPSVATAPALVLVGAYMVRPIQRIRWGRLDDAIPAFLAMVLIPLTYSITQGIIWGFLAWTGIKILTGRREEVSGTLLVIDAFAVVALVLE